MRIQKSLSAIAAAVVLAVSLSSCLSSSPAGNTSDTSAATTAAEVSEAGVPAFAASAARDIPSTELVKEIHLGWNLGNTLDATIGEPTGNETPQDWETAWGNPATTKNMIDSVHMMGFNALRLPVTWEGKFGGAPDYKIDEAWLARVREIADYAFENEMYVIINMHHEEWNMPTAENAAPAEEKLRALWGQIADYFADYNEKLIFECMNEPRLKNTPL